MMILDDIMPSERSQTQKDRYCMVPLIKVPKGVKFTETEYGGGHQEAGGG